MKNIMFFIFLLFIACSTKPPEWYNKIYSDNQNFIFATGEGKNKQEAISSALANASAKIAIVVKSMYKSLKYSYKADDTSAYSNNSVYDIETKTNPLIFTDYKILKLEKKDKYYVLIKIDRFKNAKYMCENINIPQVNLEKLNVFFNYKKDIKKINSIIEKLKNINALYPLCKDKLNKTLTLKKHLEKIYNNLKYKIYSDNLNTKNVIESVLNIQNSTNANIIIKAFTKINLKKIGNYKIAQINLNLTIQNSNLSKSFNITCASSSIQDFQTAKILAFEVCKKKLKKIFNN